MINNKIALLTDGITPYVMGGMQRHSFYLAKYLAKNKIYVDLYHFNQSNIDINALEVFEQEEKKYIKSTVLQFPKLDSLPGHYLRESYKYSELIYELIKNHLSEYKFIYAQGFCAWKLIEEKKKGFFSPPVGVNFHGYEMFQFAPNFNVKLQHFLLRKPVLYNTKNADFVFSFGVKIKEIIARYVDESKIIEMHNGIEESWITKNQLPINNPIKFVFVGRYERRKGIEELTEALRQNIQQKFTFDFIGAIPNEKKIQNEKIIYHGSINDVEKIKIILRNADVLVCPSHSEGMPNVILEAMASGLAVIATNVGAVSLMIDNKNGIIINPNNIEELKSAILYFVNIDQNNLTILKKASIKKIEENFLWSKIIKELIKKIQNLND